MVDSVETEILRNTSSRRNTTFAWNLRSNIVKDFSICLKRGDATMSSRMFNQYGILCSNIGLHCFHFLRTPTFSWSRCEDYPSSIETASEQFAKELENCDAGTRLVNYVKARRRMKLLAWLGQILHTSARCLVSPFHWSVENRGKIERNAMNQRQIQMNFAHRESPFHEQWLLFIVMCRYCVI